MHHNLFICLLALTVMLSGCSTSAANPPTHKDGHTRLQNKQLAHSKSQASIVKAKPTKPTLAQMSETIRAKYQNKQPKQWGERLPGIIQRLPTNEKVIALTFDACGGPTGNGYDQKLITFLEREKVPATLFVNRRWIQAHRETFLQLAKNPLFEIENHGTEHRPLSINGKSIYGIQGTRSVEEVVAEVKGNHEEIHKLTGREPKFFRTGTAYYDEVAVSIVQDMGERVAGFDVVGDAGATFSAYQVKKALLQSKPGSIVILHFNQPSMGTAEGVAQAIPLLKKKGYRFVKLEEYF